MKTGKILLSGACILFVVVIVCILMCIRRIRIHTLARMGNADAMFTLGRAHYIGGDGLVDQYVTQTEGNIWIRKAAQAGDTRAIQYMFMLSGFPDEEKVRYLKKGVEAGNMQCLEYLIEAQGQGKGGLKADVAEIFRLNKLLWEMQYKQNRTPPKEKAEDMVRRIKLFQWSLRLSLEQDGKTKVEIDKILEQIQ